MVTARRIDLQTLDIGKKAIDATAIRDLDGALRGKILEQGSPAYEEARTVWNAMIDRKPGLIVRCLGAADVIHAIRFARDNGLLVAVRGGGHNIAGNAICDGGIVIDLSQMKSVRVDRAAQRAWVEPGATLADLDKETQAFGLAVPTGINSTTGVAGLTLGGGFGWITRKFGLTIDNLLSADVVTADGELVQASATEIPIYSGRCAAAAAISESSPRSSSSCTSSAPQVLAGLVVHPFDDASELLPRYRRLARIGAGRAHVLGGHAQGPAAALYPS